MWPWREGKTEQFKFKAGFAKSSLWSKRYTWHMIVNITIKVYKYPINIIIEINKNCQYILIYFILLSQFRNKKASITPKGLKEWSVNTAGRKRKQTPNLLSESAQTSCFGSCTIDWKDRENVRDVERCSKCQERLREGTTKHCAL